MRKSYLWGTVASTRGLHLVLTAVAVVLLSLLLFFFAPSRFAEIPAVRARPAIIEPRAAVLLLLQEEEEEEEEEAAAAKAAARSLFTESISGVNAIISYEPPAGARDQRVNRSRSLARW